MKKKDFTTEDTEQRGQSPQRRHEEDRQECLSH